MRRRFVGSGAACCALAVAAGALGAHALAGRLDAHGLQLWETAARYLMYGGLGQMAAGLLADVAHAASVANRADVAAPGSRQRAGAAVPAAGWALLGGTAIFAGTVGGLALGGPRWLGAVTPVGGLAMIAGFGLLAWAGWRRA